MVRSTDTAPELRLQNLLKEHGLEFEKHPGDILGRPDIVMRGDRVAIFVHGCFWHRHSKCGRDALPKSNTMHWLVRFRRTAQRHEDVSRWLCDHGWRVLTVWECHLKHAQERTTVELSAFIPALAANITACPFSDQRIAL